MAEKRTSGLPKPAAGVPGPAAPFAVPEWPANTVKHLPLGEIIPYERNARTHPAAQITLLANLMKRHGVDQPIVVDEANVILKGHGRLKAAHEAGFKTFPVVMHRGLSGDDKKAIRIADNQSALLSGWDNVMLREEAIALKLSGYDMPLLGFGEAEYAALTMDEIVDPLNEWRNMPEFKQEDKNAFRTIIVHFGSQADVDAFAALVDKQITDKTKFIWIPERERGSRLDKVYE